MIQGQTTSKPVARPTTDPDWWRGATIYQIYPRSFQDHSGNGVGDLVGITQRLEYIADLGVDAIWLSPFFTSPMKDFGYDVSNYRDVDPIFGSLSDFDRLLEKAHELGLKVIIDQVISHSSDQHAWFQESRQSRDNARADWYIWAEPQADGTPPNNWLSIFGGSAWTWDGRRKQYYMHNFLASQPDLNFHNPAVRDAMLGEMRFWLERGVDGFRLDTVNFYFHSVGLERNPPVKPEDYNASTAPDVNPYNLQDHLFDKSQPENAIFMERIRALLDEFPGTTSVGEIGDAQRQIAIMAEYTTGNKRLHMAYTFDFLGGEFTDTYFRNAINEIEAKSPNGWTCLAFSNHDVVRHITRWAPHGKEDAIARLAAAIIMSMRGTVCLYQGEELGLTEAELSYDELVDPYGKEFWPEFKGRDGCRTPMVWQSAAHLGGFTTAHKSWLPVPTDHLGRAVDLQDDSKTSVLAYYRAFTRFRKHHPALIKGKIALIDAPEGILAFTRTEGDEAVFCAFNMGNQTHKMDVPRGWRLHDIDAPGSVPTPKTEVLSLGPLEAYLGAIEK